MKAEEILNTTCDQLKRKTRANTDSMFKVLISNYFSIVASMMHTKVDYLGELLPVNMYSLVLAPSGSGKNMSINLLNEYIGEAFHEEFKNNIAKKTMKSSIVKLANKLGNELALDPNEIKQDLYNELTQSGGVPLVFGSATLPAIRQFHRLGIITGAGSLNLRIDEAGSNFNEVEEVLPAFLSLYDKGILDIKLLKGSTQQKAQLPVTGAIPANMIMFGTQSALLDSADTEKKFRAQLATGYARRLVMAYVEDTKDEISDPEELYEMLTGNTNQKVLAEIQQHFKALADPRFFEQVIETPKAQAIKLIAYDNECKAKASKLSFYSENSGEKAELQNRAYRAVKLAGAFAFVEGQKAISEENVDLAIRIVDKSGEDFKQIINSPKGWQRLAEYLVDRNCEVTHDDLLNDLPFMQGTRRKDIIDLAIAYGYKNNIVIERSTENGIEFLKGSKLTETSLDAISLSWSRGITEGYRTETTTFNKLHQLALLPECNFCVHGFEGGNRHSENVNTHFNLLVLDVDGTASLEEVKFLMEDWTYLIYTTKSHNDHSHRFRIILPLSHHLEFTEDTYKEFMENVFKWLPFEVDTSAKDIARKWSTNQGQSWYNEGKLFDVTPFIPRTSKANDQQKQYLNTESLSNLERWCVNHESGNRNNNLSRYALALLDADTPILEIESLVLSMNQKYTKPLKQSEIEATVFKTLRKKYQLKESA